MKLRDSGFTTVRAGIWVLAAVAVCSMVSLEAARGGERQFLVILANSPKEFNPPCDPLIDDPCPDKPYDFECIIRPLRTACVTPCEDDDDCEDVTENEGPTFVCDTRIEYCVIDHPAPEDVRKQYFDAVDDTIGSFAEYWEEISYGDVTIRGQVTDWINLPWAITLVRLLPDEELDDPDLQSDVFDNRRAMVIVDIDGDPFGADNGPFQPEGNPRYARGGGDTLGGVPGEVPVWMPGERFVDMDGDGRWDGLDEAMNQMDWDGDGLPDLLGPWIDLNRNGTGDNPNDCLYQADDDNDGNPNCCPDGPGTVGCDPFPASGACPPMTWDGPSGAINDCNGNMIPDSCDVSEPGLPNADCRGTGWLALMGDSNCRVRPDGTSLCGASTDRLPMTAGDDACDQESPNGIPDECEYTRVTEDCVETLSDGDDDPCLNVVVCDPLDPQLTDNVLIPRCEYHDANADGNLDIVEPFENHLTRWAGVVAGWIEVDDDYIRKHYPGNPNLVIARGEARAIYGGHDPNNLVTGAGCHCATVCDTSADCPGAELCDTSVHRCECLIVSGDEVCVAGFHAQYDPPDWWLEPDPDSTPPSNKMQQEGCSDHAGGLHGSVRTPEPDWYQDMWQEWYGTAPPPWGSGSPRMVPFNDRGSLMRCGIRTFDYQGRKRFRATDGGTNGDGSGWIGCGDADRFVHFSGGEGVPTLFEEDCNAQILPEETGGFDQDDRRIYYDGPREFDDLPSSKYHTTGDGRLGEATSPFSYSIWGQDLGDDDPDTSNPPDGFIPAAGPYATSIHGNLGHDAGNQLHIEMLAFAHGAGSFGDATLDGLVDQGNARRAGRDSYFGRGTRRLMEDCIEILDDLIDFDDFVDAVSLDRLNCGGTALATTVPWQYRTGDPEEDAVLPSGVCSGIVLLNERVHSPCNAWYHSIGTDFFPIHNEDGLDDARFRDATFPRSNPAISWNVFFHHLVRGIGVGSCSGTIPRDNFQTAYAAHQWLHTWEDFPDLYDYDVFQDGAIENCPIGFWDIMADGGLVHSVPILKEKPCTDWTVTVDLATILTPGVDTILTLPPAEFQRDKSYYFLENDNRRGERYYFWSAGQGFDRRMPESGLLVLHSDVTPLCRTDAECPEGIECVGGFCEGAVSNPDAPPPQQRNTTRPTYMIVQSDGNGELDLCDSRGDAGDPWPGSTGATRFNFETNPRATWYTQNSWTGLDIQNIITDGEGSARITINWVPTSIPSLRFRDPPGGESVGSTYQVRFQATDVYGGSTISVYYTEDRKTCGSGSTDCDEHADCSAGELCTHDLTIAPGGQNRIGTMRKSTPGTNELSMNWNISTVPDGRYVLFAKLQPGAGADGSEASNTTPHPGRNNKGNGSLAVINVDIAGNKARSETWTAVCIDADTGLWRVNSSLSQPVLNEDDPDSDPYTRATTGQLYESVGGEVDFRITSGSDPFELGDTFAFTTTGITAPSGGVTIRERRITLDPVAIIFASPLAGPPPLAVTFDARDSFDPNGEAINYLWDFGDSSAAASGPVVQHTYTDAGTFTTVLTVTNTQNARFNETAVDIEVTNNSPQAVISATPTSGDAPLTVQFGAGQSSDTETDAADLTYHWDFGDGETANDVRIPGSAFLSISHFYRDQNGVDCDHDNPCTFTATLTVIDQGGKQDTDTVKILVGNNDPVPVISHTSLRLTVNNIEVVFNAMSSFDSDPEDTDLMVTWIWGDASVPAEETFPLTGVAGATDGSVPHTYVLPAGQTTGSFRTTAIVSDGRGGEGVWAGVTITVNEAAVGSSSPRAIFTIDPPSPKLDEEFTVDGSLSFDRPVGSPIASYSWDFGDNSTVVSGVTATHAYTQAGSYTIALTVADGETPPNTDTTRQTVIIAGDGDGGDDDEARDNAPPIAAFTVNPPRGIAGTTAFVFNASGSTDPDGDDSQLTFRWSFGDGANATGATPPPHVYAVANPSGYRVRLTVRDEGNASTTATTEVIVEGSAGNVPPVAHIATGPRTGTAPVSLTFDGRNSYDPNGDLLEYRWEFFDAAGDLIDMLTGEIVTRLFSTVGTFTVELEVLDGRGESDRAGPETILVTERGVAPPIDDGPGQDVPDDNGGQDSAEQRPRRFCAVGALPGLFGSLLGLMALSAARWRRRI